MSIHFNKSIWTSLESKLIFASEKDNKHPWGKYPSGIVTWPAGKRKSERNNNRR